MRKAFRMIGEGAKSMEDVADRIVRYLYDNLIDGETGQRACALVRLFKTHSFLRNSIPNCRTLRKNMLGNKSPYPGMKCYGSSGDDRGGTGMAFKEDLCGSQGNSSPE